MNQADNPVSKRGFPLARINGVQKEGGRRLNGAVEAIDEALTGIEERLPDDLKGVLATLETALGRKIEQGDVEAVKTEILEALRGGVTQDELDTFKELADAVKGNDSELAVLNSLIAERVTSVAFTAFKGFVEDQLNLKADATALDAKSSVGHRHSIGHVGNLREELDAKAGKATTEAALAGKAPKAHEHSLSDIVNLITALQAKADVDAVNQSLSLKADSADMTEALNAKVDKATLSDLPAFDRYSDWTKAQRFNNGLIAANGLIAFNVVDWEEKRWSSPNIDHIWHDDTGNAYNFVSDGPLKSKGNAHLKAGMLQLHKTGAGVDGPFYALGHYTEITSQPDITADSWANAGSFEIKAIAPQNSSTAAGRRFYSSGLRATVQGYGDGGYFRALEGSVSKAMLHGQFNASWIVGSWGIAEAVSDYSGTADNMEGVRGLSVVNGGRVKVVKGGNFTVNPNNAEATVDSAYGAFVHMSHTAGAVTNDPVGLLISFTGAWNGKKKIGIRQDGVTQNNLTGHLCNSGAITATGDVTAFSDPRLKSNMKPISDALDLVMKLEGISFEMNGVKSLGFNAAKLKAVVPELVRENEEVKGLKGGPVLSVAYGNTVALLVEAVKELAELVGVEHGASNKRAD